MVIGEVEFAVAQMQVIHALSQKGLYLVGNQRRRSQAISPPLCQGVRTVDAALLAPRLVSTPPSPLEKVPGIISSLPARKGEIQQLRQLRRVAVISP